MDAEMVRALIAQGEGQEVEFKSSLADSRAIISTLAAFANSRGGALLVGVSDQGAVVGAELGRRTIDQFANKLSQGTDPQLYAEIDRINLDGGSVVVITVPPSSGGLITAFGAQYRRVGTTTRKVRSAPTPVGAPRDEHSAYASLLDRLPDPLADLRPEGKPLRELHDLEEAIRRIERHV